jgi:hypothetical protein
LYRHITQDHGLPLLLLLNKCDLVPAAAAAAWQRWLQQQLPGVTVVPVSAAKEQAHASAHAVLRQLLQLRVRRGPQQAPVPVQELVGLPVGERVRAHVGWHAAGALGLLRALTPSSALTRRSRARVACARLQTSSCRRPRAATHTPSATCSSRPAALAATQSMKPQRVMVVLLKRAMRAGHWHQTGQHAARRGGEQGAEGSCGSRTLLVVAAARQPPQQRLPQEPKQQVVTPAMMVARSMA